MKRNLLQIALFAVLGCSFALAQTTTTVTGAIRDLANALVTSGKVTFVLTPSRDTTISGYARFSPNTVTCAITGAGLIKAQDGVSVCTVTKTTALQPTGTYYIVCYWPGNVKTACFTFYAVNDTYDWSTVVPTPTTSPAQNFVDVFSNQSIGGAKTWSGTQTFTGTNNFPGVNNFNGNNNFSGVTNAAFQSLNGIQFADQFANINACITAAAALSTPGKCYVPTGTANTAQIEMATGVTLEFAPGTFTNSGTSGGIFVHFGSGVSRAVVKGSGVGSTLLRNAPTGTQFGAIVQDEGTENTVADMTLDGNGNTTSTLVTTTTVRNHTRNLRLLHDLTTNGIRNYAWHIRGGTDYDSSNVIANGGTIDAIFFDASFGAIAGGTFTNLTASNSPFNGIDITCGPAGKNITNLKFVNVTTTGNGTHTGSDDKYGFSTFGANGNACAQIGLQITNLVTTGNQGSGLRIKGNNVNWMITGLYCDANGADATAADRDCIVMKSDAAAVPSHNKIAGYARKGSATNALSTDSGTGINFYWLDIGTDAISLAASGAQDSFLFNKGTGGASSSSGFDLSLQTLAACLGTVGIVNVTGVGVCISAPAKITGTATFGSGVAADGAGFKHKRSVAGCATAATAGAVCTTTIAWGTAFADANYTPTCIGSGVASGVPTLGAMTARVAASITVQTVAITAVAAQFNNVECIAVHD